MTDTAKIMRIAEPSASKTALRKMAAATKPASRHHVRRLRRQGAAAIAIGAVAGTLTALSLSHLAHGISIVTGAPSWEAWAMAIGVDIGFVGLEVSMLAAATDKVRVAIGRWARPAVVGTLLGSAAMNAFAFASAASGIMLAAAIVMGLAIPALIYCLTRICATLYIDCHSRG